MIWGVAVAQERRSSTTSGFWRAWISSGCRRIRYRARGRASGGGVPGRYSRTTGLPATSASACGSCKKWAQEAGLYPALGTCVACGVRPGEIFHSENYADLWNVIRVCRSCHSAIHSRFRHPAAWARRLALNTCESGGRWLKLLPREPIDVAGWLRARNVPSFLWPAPRR